MVNQTWDNVLASMPNDVFRKVFLANVLAGIAKVMTNDQVKLQRASLEGTKADVDDLQGCAFEIITPDKTVEVTIRSKRNG